MPLDQVVCPGWLVQQSAVIEGAEAYTAFKHGSLREFFPRLENRVVEAVKVAVVAFNAAEAEKIRQLKKK